MKKIYHLSSCSTCVRIINELELKEKKFEFQDIKTEKITSSQLAEMKKMLPITADFYASALDGTNVENIFLKLAESIINVN